LVKKKVSLANIADLKQLVEPENSNVSITRQCDILGLCRSSYYYKPAAESPLNLELMRIIDEQYTRTPFYGVPRMTHLLCNMGYSIGHKRIERLMRKMGIQAIYPKKNLSKTNADHKKFPYLLKGLDINRPGMGNRYNIHKDEIRVYASCSHHGLVFEICYFVETI
jgi:putative transposase